MRQFKNFGATHLYCNNCAKSMPVREKMLLELPDGALFDYLCVGCSESLGTRKETKSLANYPQEHMEEDDNNV